MSEQQKPWSKMNAAERAAYRAARVASESVKEAPETDPVPEPFDPMAEAAEPIGDPVLTDDELERIQQEVRRKIEGELAAVAAVKRKELIAKELDRELLRQRREAGLTDHRDDLLEICIDVAPFANDIRIDDRIYQHGHWYTVDRRRYDALREIMARSWDAEERAGNPNRRFRREMAGTMNSIMNERRLPDGTLTMALNTRVHGKSGSAVNAPQI